MRSLDEKIRTAPLISLLASFLATSLARISSLLFSFLLLVTAALEKVGKSIKGSDNKVFIWRITDVANEGWRFPPLFGFLKHKEEKRKSFIQQSKVI